MAVRGKPAGDPTQPRQEPPKPEKPAEVPAADREVETTDNEKPKAKRKPKPWEDMDESTRKGLMLQAQAKISRQREVLADARTEMNTQNGVLRKMIQEVKSELGPDCMDYINLLEKLTTDEGLEAVRQTMRAAAKAFEWGGIAEGQQLSLFWEDPPADLRPLDEVAYDEGVRAYWQGQTRQVPAQYSTGDKRYGEWLRGYADGQEANMKRIRELRAADAEPIGEEPESQAQIEGPPADRDLTGLVTEDVSADPPIEDAA